MEEEQSAGAGAIAPEDCLEATPYMDFEHPAVAEFTVRHGGGPGDQKARAIALFYAVRDLVRYNPYSIDLRPDGLRASTTLARGQGFCINKAALYGACLRAIGIPARLGYADVKNHLASQRLIDRMGSDLFAYHGYTEVYLDDKWVKATPVFNLSLCQKFGVQPLEFDGESDSIFHPFDASGRQHMEYVADRGVYRDLPREEIIDSFTALYPAMIDQWGIGSASGDLEAEAEAEFAGR